MSEFVDRMAVQRLVLRTINKHRRTEELCGLSRAAIERWAQANHLHFEAPALMLLVRISDQLFVLASHSDDHLNEDYAEVSKEIRTLLMELEAVLLRGES